MKIGTKRWAKKAYIRKGGSPKGTARQRYINDLVAKARKQGKGRVGF